MKKKLVLPGEHLASAEEVIPGENTYTENDEVYSSSFGELRESERKADVGWEKARRISSPHIGMDLYCVVRKTSATKAFLDCVPAADLEKTGSRMDISAVLPVQNIRSGRVREVRDELRAGDVIKAKISKVVRDDVDVSIFGNEYGVVKAFCSECRNGMVLKGDTLICSNCEREEKRKLSDEYPKR